MILKNLVINEGNDFMPVIEARILIKKWADTYCTSPRALVVLHHMRFTRTYDRIFLL